LAPLNLTEITIVVLLKIDTQQLLQLRTFHPGTGFKVANLVYLCIFAW